MKSRSDLNQLLPPNPVCAEIGVAEGYFSAEMVRDWKSSKLFMVDNWGTIKDQTGDGFFEQDWHDKNYKAAMERVKGYPVEVLRGISWEMAVHVEDESLDLLYIDCCHMYHCVKNDLEAWYPKVKRGGICAGHDINHPMYGVRRAVDEFIRTIHVLNFNIIPENGLDASFYFTKP